jgi:CRP-like cAMP-binding protein
MNLSLGEDVKVVKKDEILFKEGDKPTRFIIVKSGGILCFKKNAGRVIPVLWAREQMIIGEEAIIGQSNHSYTAVAMEESEILEIEAKTIAAVLKVAPKWMSELLKTLGERVSDTSSIISDHKLMSPELFGGKDLSPEEETRIKKLVN